MLSDMSNVRGRSLDSVAGVRYCRARTVDYPGAIDLVNVSIYFAIVMEVACIPKRSRHEP